MYTEVCVVNVVNVWKQHELPESTCNINVLQMNYTWFESNASFVYMV